jgi:hypothetical protein
MLHLFRSRKGEFRPLSVVITLFVIIALIALVQWTRTKITIESFRSEVKAQAQGAKKRVSWNEIIIEKLLREAVDLNIVTDEEVNDGTWEDKLYIDIQRPKPDYIKLVVSFKVTTNYFITKIEKEVEIEEEAKVYTM